MIVVAARVARRLRPIAHVRLDRHTARAERGDFARSYSEEDDHACSIDILAHGTGDRTMTHHRRMRRV